MSDTLAAFEELVLLAVCSLNDDAYAVSVQQRLVDEAGRDSAMGAVYATLDRLEKKGYVTSRLGPVTHERGGRRKRFYEPTGAGMAALSTVRETRHALRALIPKEFRPRLGYAPSA